MKLLIISAFIVAAQAVGSANEDRLAESVNVTLSDVTFYLYNRNNRDEPEIIHADNFSEMESSVYFDPSKKTYVFSPGWLREYNSPISLTIKDAFLPLHDINLFVVDWSSVSKLFYTYAAASVGQIGRIVGQFVRNVTESRGIALTDVVLVGSSLGAHVMGAAGASLADLGSVDAIVGLDPGNPLFYMNDTDVRLDVTDARYVQVVHGNNGLLGMKQPVGHVDFFPNGNTMNQPGCGPDLFGSCAHGRAYEYYAESLLTSGFVSTQCDNYADFEAGSCDGNPQANLGTIDLDKEARGNFFLKTSDKQPFALH